MKNRDIDILIVEDNPADTRFVAELLKESRDPVLRVTRADHLGAALRKISGAKPDIVLLDLDLPDSQGLDTLSIILKPDQNLPVIVLTGNDSEAVGLASVRRGAADYLVKGKIDTSQLVKSIKYAITRKHAEEALAVERRNLQMIFDVVNVGMLLIDEHSVVKRVNKVVNRWAGKDFSAKLGTQPGEALGCIHALNDPAGCGHTQQCDACPMRKAFESVLNNGKPIHGIETEAVLLLDGNRTHLWLDVSIDPLVIEGEKHAIIAINDITGRKNAELALKESEKRFRVLAEAMPQMVWTADASGALDYFNQRTFEYGGIGPEDLKGWKWESVVHPEDVNYCLTVWRYAIKTGESFTIEQRLRRADGKFRWHLTRGIAVRDDNGQVIRWIGTSTDIHDQKLAEEVLKRDNRALEHLVEQKTQETMELQKETEKAKRLADIGMLAATVAHELRNPLAGIRLAAYNIKRKVPDPLIEKNLQNIDNKVTESDQIINNLLFYSKIKTSNHKNVNIFNILKASIEEAAKNSAGEASPITTDMETIKDLSVEADPLQIKEVFVNVINNAIDAVDADKGRIEINAKADSKFLTISVKDDGTGIKEANLERVFEPFFTTKAKGTGLGLSVCKQIMMLHDGFINISSKCGEGTTVTISLPIEHRP